MGVSSKIQGFKVGDQPSPNVYVQGVFPFFAVLAQRGVSLELRVEGLRLLPGRLCL